jgi:hypothetical protein
MILSIIWIYPKMPRTSGSLLHADKQYDEFKFKLTFQLYATTMPKAGIRK